MKQTLLVLLLLVITPCFAQHERDNWIMGGVSVKFQNDSMLLIPPGTSKSIFRGSSSYSNPSTGDLVFYTNGSSVFNKKHEQMPNGFKINETNSESYHSVIVPVPLSKDLFYVISGIPYYDNTYSSYKIYYSIIDMRLENGFGDVVDKANLIATDINASFCIVKQLYEEGHWLVTHGNMSNEFKSFRINGSGINLIPVVSNTGNVSCITWGESKMVSNSRGNKFVFSFVNLDTSFAVAEYLFDKGCGMVSFNQSFDIDHPNNDHSYYYDYAYGAYSSDDTKLYINKLYYRGYYLFQYNLEDSLPNKSRIIIKEGNHFGNDIQLAPNGKMYMGTDVFVPEVVSVIQKPNELGMDCGFQPYSVWLGYNSANSISHFPEFMMDNSPPSQEIINPIPIINYSCENLVASLSLIKEIKVDSFSWSLGDGSIANTFDVSHKYDTIGDYIVSFNWYMCGQKHSVVDTLQIRINPVFDFGPDTNLCSGQVLVLSGPQKADNYKWNTNDSSSSIVVKKPGIYSVKVKSGICEAEDEITVTYSDKLWTTLGSEYIICDRDQELVKLDAGEGFNQYKWTPTGDTSQWIIVGDVGKYFVVVKDYRGCDGSDGTKVERRCPVSVFYPNVFTPNNDGLNDMYLPIGTDVTAFTLTIYNAWGERIFESDQLEKGWDGKVNGFPSPAGTYIYQSTYSGFRNKKLVEFETKGNLTLLR